VDSLSENERHLQREPGVHDEAWPSLDLRVSRAPDPLIPSGDYDAYSKRFEMVSMRLGGENVERLVIFFEVRGGPCDGTLLRFIVPLPPRRRGAFMKGVAPSSKLLRSWVVANNGQHPSRADRLALDVFRHKLFRVRVRTVDRDRKQERLPECNRYSVIDALLERIA